MPRSQDPVSRPPKGKILTVGSFFTNHGPSLGLELMGDSTGLERPIYEPTINRPGLALAGFFRYFASRRIQVVGHAELSYLRSLSSQERKERIEALFEQRIPCLVVARGLPLPSGILELADEAETPIFRSPLIKATTPSIITSNVTIRLTAGNAPNSRPGLPNPWGWK